MDKTIFYAPDILENLILPEEESAHCCRVLRKSSGDSILITDGKGRFFDAEIAVSHPKNTSVRILEEIAWAKSWKPHIHIAFAPTKNMDRTEWFVEKATEIGVDELTPLLTQHSERKEIKPVRIEKILISAMKQSQKALLPVLNPMIAFPQFIMQSQSAQKFIAHCFPDEKQLLSASYTPNNDVLILIGPEGDFSEEEVKLALDNAFRPVSLGESRLRTETAALVACQTIHTVTELM